MKYIHNYLRLFRYKNLIFLITIQYLLRYKIIIPNFGIENIISLLNFNLILFSILLIITAGYVINNYFDINIDLINNDKKIIVGRDISRRTTLFIHAIFTLLGLIIGIITSNSLNSVYFTFYFLFTSYILWTFSLRLKRNYIISCFIFPFIYSGFIFSISFFEIKNNHLNPQIFRTISILFVYIMFGFILTLIHEIVKDFRGLKGDKLHNIKTLPIIWGINKTKEFIKWLTIFLCFCIIFITTYIFKNNIYAILYSIFLLILPISMLNLLVYKASNSNDYDRILNLNNLIIVIGVLSLFFFN